MDCALLQADICHLNARRRYGNVNTHRPDDRTVKCYYVKGALLSNGRGMTLK